MNYNNFYERNIGIFTPDEQMKLKNSSVFIAGVGGVGGIQAVTIARMGVGKIIIMDPGVFDEPDMNRQYGAKKSTLGRNKAEVMAEILIDAAPCAKVEFYTRKLEENELRNIIADISLVVDAIDLCDFKYKTLLAKTTRAQKKYHLCSPIPDLGAILMIIDPLGMTFEEFTNCQSYPPMFPRTENINNTKSEIPCISSISTSCAAANLSAAMLATEAALIIVGKKPKKDLVVVPHVTHLSLFPLFCRIFDPLNQ